jgi:hypothetical protein
MVPRLGEHVAVSRRRCASLGAASLLFTFSSAWSADVAGEFTVAGRVIAPKFAAAYPVRDPRDPRRRAVEVMLSEGMLDAQSVAAELDPHTRAINQEGLGNYVVLWVRPEGGVSMNATFAKSMTQYLDNTGGGFLGGNLIAELSANTPERVAGRVRTAAAVKTMSQQSYTLDVSFAATVDHPTAGSALAAGGGEAGKAFDAFHAAIRRKDWRTARTRVSRKRLSALEESDRSAAENRDYALDVLRWWLPKRKPKVTGGELRAGEAVLEVEGESVPNRRALYLVRMVEEDSTWRFDESTLAGLL